MSFCDAELVEGGDDIQLYIDFGTANSIESLADQWQRVSVLNYNAVQALVVLTDTNSPSRLRSKEKGRGAPSPGLSNKPLA